MEEMDVSLRFRFGVIDDCPGVSDSGAVRFFDFASDFFGVS